MIFQCLHSRMYIAPCRSMIVDVSGLPLSRQEALYPKWYRNVLLQAMWQTCFYCVYPRTEFWEFSQFSHVSLTLGISSCWHGQVAPSMSSTSSPIYAGANLGRKLPCPWLGYMPYVTCIRKLLETHRRCHLNLWGWMGHSFRWKSATATNRL